MTLRNRFLLVGLGIFVFVITTPVITLYALGYKFDLTSRQIQKTGSLIVRSEPDGAAVHLDDVVQPRKTDTTIRFLLPGDYVVKVSKDGYQSWTKRLNVRSSLVTWANQGREWIALFRQEPKLEHDYSITSYSFDPEGRQLAVVQGGQVMSYDAGDGDLNRVSDTVPAFDPPVTVTSPETLFYINRYAPAQVFTSAQVNGSRHLDANGSYAAVLVGTDLSYSKDGKVLPLAADVSGFDLDGDFLWYVQANELRRMNLNQGVVETVADLGQRPVNSRIIRGNSKVFLVLDGVLYALNDGLEEIRRSVTYAYWDEPSGRLLAATNNEVSLFDPSSVRSEVVIRSSTAVGQPVINQETGYLFFLNEGKVKAIELDGRDHRNVYTISDHPTEAFLLSPDGTLLGSVNGTSLTTYKIR